MKKKYMLAALALVGVLAGAGGTVAYFTAYDEAKPVFTLGDVAAELTEPTWDPEADHVIAPGASFDKNPQVTNTGTNDAYVRIHISIPEGPLATIRGALPADEQDIFTPDSLFVPTGSDWTPAEDDPVTKDGEVVYTYTYNDVLPAGKATQPVFEKVYFPANLSKEAIFNNLEGAFIISVSADVIQADSFASADEAFAAFDNQA